MNVNTGQHNRQIYQSAASGADDNTSYSCTSPRDTCQMKINFFYKCPRPKHLYFVESDQSQGNVSYSLIETTKHCVSINRSLSLKENSTMNKTEAQIFSYGILYLNPICHQCQPSYKKYIAVETPPSRHKMEALGRPF